MTVEQTALTRRERQRQATYAEIVEVSRRLLRTEGGLSLRAVAAEMGMTAPALYRYVDSYQQLLMLVAQHVFGDVLAELEVAAGRFPDDDPAAQITAGAVAFRRWALRNRAEFSLVFANPETADRQGAKENPDSPGAAFGAFFSEIFARVWQRYDFALPADDEIEPAVLEVLRSEESKNTLPCDFPGMPYGLGWMFIRCWLRLYGTVTLEVFGHMDPGIIASGALFRAMLEDMARDLNLGADWPRLQALAGTEMTA